MRIEIEYDEAVIADSADFLTATLLKENLPMLYPRRLIVTVLEVVIARLHLKATLSTPVRTLDLKSTPGFFTKNRDQPLQC